MTYLRYSVFLFVVTMATLPHTEMSAQTLLPSNWYECDRITSQWLNTVIAVDADIAVAAGRDGTIIRTTDQGSTWTRIEVGTNDEYSSAVMDSQSRIYMTVDQERTGWGLWDGVVMSRDMGSTWELISNEPLRSIHRNGVNNEVWGVPSNGSYVVVSTDGCRNWRKIDLPTTNRVHTVGFVSNLEVYVGCSNGTLLYSADGGATWIRHADGVVNGTIKSIEHIVGRVVVVGGDYAGVAISSPARKDQFDTIVANSYPYIHSVSNTGRNTWFLQENGVFWKADLTTRSNSADGIVIQGWDYAPSAISWHGQTGLGFIVTRTGRVFKTKDHGLGECTVQIKNNPESVLLKSGADLELRIDAEPEDVSVKWQVKIPEAAWTDVVAAGNNVTLNNGALKIIGLGVGHHQRQYRAIAFNRQCSDTSLAAFVQVVDTCSQTIYDTVRIGVTDTLYITLAPSSTGSSDSAYVKVYPNPTTSHIVIETEQYANLADWVLVITDVTGKTVHRSAVTDNVQLVSLKELSGTGQYFLLLQDEKGQIRATRVLVVR